MINPKHILVCTTLAIGLVSAAAGAAQSQNEQFDGIIVPARSWDIAPQINGHIESTTFSEGSLVAKGDVLVELNPNLAQLKLDLAKEKLNIAETTLAEHEADLHRQAELREREAVSISKFSDVELATRLAAISVRSAAIELEVAKLNRAAHTVKAPADGLISAPFVNEGSNYNTETSGPIGTVYQLDPIRVRMSLSLERAMEQILSGRFELGTLQALEIELILPGGTKYPHSGRIVTLGTELDEETGAGSALIEFPNPGMLLRPGIPVKVARRD